MISETNFHKHTLTCSFHAFSVGLKIQRKKINNLKFFHLYSKPFFQILLFNFRENIISVFESSKNPPTHPFIRIYQCSHFGSLIINSISIPDFFFQILHSIYEFLFSFFQTCVLQTVLLENKSKKLKPRAHFKHQSKCKILKLNCVDKLHFL